MRGLVLGALLCFTWAVAVFHRGVFPPPSVTAPVVPKPATWIAKDEGTIGINQLVLQGAPYERGLQAGRHTAKLLFEQENSLREKFESFLPLAIARHAFVIATIRWFWGIERYFEPWMTEEMYGVSKYAPHEFDDLMDGLTRQIAYHGLHEVGQWLVDRGNLDMGCTVLAIPSRGSWVIGRNFDFEGGRIFDDEKILKWVFPDDGYPFVSVIWAGMVGLVTAVNDRGIYVSINAAGSNEYRRYGTPSTLVALKAVQFSASVEEAVATIEKQTTIITDIFVVSDGKRAFRVEKSPRRVRTTELKSPEVVTNHLQDAAWQGDEVNDYRMRELTTVERFERGRALLASLGPKDDVVRKLLGFLRDRHDAAGRPLDAGNRKAIDGLIATHSVIYDAREGTLFVGRGPAVAGAFVGFDLRESFRARYPVVTAELPRDPELDRETFLAIKQAIEASRGAGRTARKGKCAEAGAALARIPSEHRKHAVYYSALGDYEACRKEKASAKTAWLAALGLSPAYPQEKRELERKLEQ